MSNTSLEVQLLERKNEFLGQFGEYRTFTNARGQTIATYLWPAWGSSGINQTPRAVVHLLHGHGAYACYDWLKFSRGPKSLGLYADSWVEVLNKAGYSVVAIDVHGAGRSEGLRCYTESFDHYVDEVEQSIKLASTFNVPGFPPIATAGGGPQPGAVPRYLLGGSMGGCLATVLSVRFPDLISGLILLAPMLSLEKLSQKGLNRYLRLLAPIVSALVPKLAIVKVSRNSLYPELQEVYDQDPNCWHGNTRARNGYEYIRTTHMLMNGGLEKVTCPFLVFHGLQDDMVDPDGSRALYARAKSVDKTLKLLDHMWHVLCKEPGHSGLLADTIAWLDERTAKTGAGPSPNTTLLTTLKNESVAQLDALAKARPELIAFFSKAKTVTKAV